MKLLLICFINLTISHVVIAQSITSRQDTLSPTVIGQTNSPLFFKFKKYDFGKIPKGKPVTVDFDFTNISNKPIIIENATAQCGCTTPVFPKSGIAAGNNNKISITYNAANPGVFMKQVTIKVLHYPEPIYLVVSGQVMPSAPQKNEK